MEKGIVNRIAFSLFLGSFTIIILARGIAHSFPKETALFINVFVGFLMLPLTWMFIKGLPVTNLEKRKYKAEDFISWFFIAVVGLFALSLVGHQLSIGLAKLFGQDSSPEIVKSFVSNLPIWFNILALVIVGPIVEELLFRGIILKRLMPYGKKMAIAVSALLFSIYHMNLEQAFYTFGIGLVFGILMIKTGRHIFPIMMHMALNFWGGTLPVILASNTNLLGAINMAVIFVGIILLIVRFRTLTGSKEDIYHTIKLTPKILWANWGMVCFTGLWLIMNVRSHM